MRTIYQKVMDVWSWVCIDLFGFCYLLMLVPAAHENGLFVNTFNVMITVLGLWRLVTFVHDEILGRWLS